MSWRISDEPIFLLALKLFTLWNSVLNSTSPEESSLMFKITLFLLSYLFFSVISFYFMYELSAFDELSFDCSPCLHSPSPFWEKKTDEGFWLAHFSRLKWLTVWGHRHSHLSIKHWVRRRPFNLTHSPSLKKFLLVSINKKVTINGDFPDDKILTTSLRWFLYSFGSHFKHDLFFHEWR